MGEVHEFIAKTLGDRERVSGLFFPPKEKREMKKRFEKLDFTVLSPGDKLIIQTPKIIGDADVVSLARMARRFLTDPHESVLIVPDRFVFFLLKKGSSLEVELKNGKAKKKEIIKEFDKVSEKKYGSLSPSYYHGAEEMLDYLNEKLDTVDLDNG